MRAARIIPDGRNTRSTYVRLGTNDYLFEPDILLAAQIGRARADSPERQLMVAALEAAVDTLKHPDRHTAADVRREREWFESTDDTRLFSFEQVCQHLGLEASRIRAAVLFPRPEKRPQETARRARACVYRTRVGA